ncbi:protein-export membrane protein SecF [Candidatus Gottesmanbacteria bacterium RIFCSPLOWO2_01_FULL_48_11]|uniref:Protein-export membrane protein SecF n=2 Tax=Candidatus Gottesmaniibacteriota TaxID=1752720 RepID=A0A0G1WC70_9BACT|nr:MAG: Protein translocase subunit SecF [Candidatus Gottesmanbacteria bacterium GW2011_GWA2_47_9]OGG28376.1 MAG: protein-export membrane protein SecF [Candidatus Gottesmanbacteria bacterium RIFCSPLOWO2_01_FULL_48_11]
MIRFSKYLWVYLLVSAIVLVPGVYSLVRFGLRPAIDFTGGTLLEIQFSRDVPQNIVELVANKDGLALVSIQKTSSNTYLLRMKPEGSENVAAFQTSLATSVGEIPEVVRNETVGPVLGKELLQKTLAAAIMAVIGILLYVAWAFKNVRFGVAAIVALIHDLLVVVGIFSLLGKYAGVEVDTLFVTAILTTMSFSVHDTIVVFDRIRELLRGKEKGGIAEISDMALTQTLGRSLANSFTILFMLLALVLLGGVTIRWFALALLIGTISGTYSSPFVATPILIFWERLAKKQK